MLPIFECKKLPKPPNGRRSRLSHNWKHLHNCIIADIKTYIEEPKIYDVFGTKMYTETFYNFGKDKHVENKM